MLCSITLSKAKGNSANQRASGSNNKLHSQADMNRYVKENVAANKDPRPRGAIFRGAAIPYFLRVHGGIGSAWLSEVTWLYRIAWENGSSIF